MNSRRLPSRWSPSAPAALVTPGATRQSASVPGNARSSCTSLVRSRVKRSASSLANIAKVYVPPDPPYSPALLREPILDVAGLLAGAELDDAELGQAPLAEGILARDRFDLGPVL